MMSAVVGDALLPNTRCQISARTLFPLTLPADVSARPFQVTLLTVVEVLAMDTPTRISRLFPAPTVCAQVADVPLLMVGQLDPLSAPAPASRANGAAVLALWTLLPP